MKKTCFYIVFILVAFKIKAQENLIYNGDFEIYDTCPSNISTPGDLQVEHCENWTAPTKLGTSDYYNICNNDLPFHFAGVPQNAAGYQKAYSGDGYVGFYAWDIVFDFDYREYVHTKLIKPLEKNKSYKISFYLSEASGNYAVKHIGALLTENEINLNTYSPLVYDPQFFNQQDYISDSLGWTKIEGSFIANGEEQYLTIGYFEDSTKIFDTLRLSEDEFTAKSIYYYLDKVELIEENETYLTPNYFSPNEDGINDLWYVETMDDEEIIYIFNRWGNIIRQEKLKNFVWDGKTNEGIECVEGNYFYILKKSYKSGFIQLVR